MIKDSDVNDFLKELCRIYVAEFGTSLAMLQEWCFSYTITAENSVLMGILTKSFPEDRLGDGLELIFQELVEREYLCHNPDVSFQLTKKGYVAGTQGKLSKFLSFFNINPGINTLIAILSLVIAIAALYVSITRP